MMKLAILPGCLLAFTVLAAPGDSLSVLGDNVNVRTGPSLKHPVVLKLHKGHTVVEFQRNDEWVKIGEEKTGEELGWIHSSMTGRGTAEGSASYSPVIENSTQVAADRKFRKFMTSFAELNAGIKSENGLEFFTKAEDLGSGIIQITATDAWINTTEDNKTDALHVLFNLWAEAAGTGSSIAIHIIDEQGTQHMSMYR